MNKILAWGANQQSLLFFFFSVLLSFSSLLFFGRVCVCSPRVLLLLLTCVLLLINFPLVPPVFFFLLLGNRTERCVVVTTASADGLIDFFGGFCFLCLLMLFHLRERGWGERGEEKKKRPGHGKSKAHMHACAFEPVHFPSSIVAAMLLNVQ